MSEESRGIPKYRLIATVCHHGFDFSGMSSGHYIANCKSASGVWHTFDDIQVLWTSIICNRVDLKGAVERGVERPGRLYIILCKRRLHYYSEANNTRRLYITYSTACLETEWD